MTVKDNLTPFGYNKFILAEHCRKNGIRFCIIYEYDEIEQDTVYVLHDFSRSVYIDTEVAAFAPDCMDLSVDVCGMLNHREISDRNKE